MERCTTLCDKVCRWLATGQWFSLGTMVFSTNKTVRHNITEILFKLVLHHNPNRNKMMALQLPMQSKCIITNQWLIDWFIIVLNATFSNISAISWPPVLVVEEEGYPEEPPTMDKQLVNLSLAAASRVHLFLCNLQSRVRSHIVLVIGLYELLGNLIKVYHHY